MKQLCSCGIAFAALIVSALIWGSSPSKAAGPSNKYSKCINRTTTNFDWRQCGAAEINRQETHLASSWKKALTCFDESDQTQRDAKQSLIAEERLWINWKDEACKFYEPSREGDSDQGFAGREGQVLAMPSCRAEIIAQRAAFLDGLAKDCR